jgi:hypothetical protein
MFVLPPPAMNDAGNIAFTAITAGPSPAIGLYSGADPQADKVLETGDMLDGIEVEMIALGRHGINNHGQIVFHVLFTDASQAIYRADPMPSVHVLTGASPHLTVSAGSSIQVCGTSGTNQITIENGAKADLIHFPGYNTIDIQSSAGLFTVSRSGTVVTFQGQDGTLLKIPATATFQTLDFTDITGLELSIQGNQVMLGDQVIGTEQSPVTGD